jgi:hypothetical protein
MMTLRQKMTSRPARPGERDQLPDLGFDPIDPLALLGSSHEVTRAEGWGHTVQPILAVNSLARAGQDLGIDVAGLDGDASPAVPQGLERRYRNAVRLLTGGTPGAPDPHPTIPGWEQHLIAQEVEVVRLPEEVGLVGRDAVDHLLQLPALRVGPQEMIMVLFERRVSVVPEPPGQPGTDQLPLGRTQGDARGPQDELPERFERGVADLRRLGLHVP